MKKISIVFATLWLLPVLVFANPPPAPTDPSKGAESSLDVLGDVGGVSYGEDAVDWAKSPGDPLAMSVGILVNWVLGLLGIFLTLLIIYAGYLWFTAGGNEEKTTKARQILLNAVIGLAITMAAYAISYFVFYRLSLATQLNTTTIQ